jgi:hypothetical protein
MPKSQSIKVYDIIVSMEDEGQKDLHTFGLTTKTTAREDMRRVWAGKLEGFARSLEGAENVVVGSHYDRISCSFSIEKAQDLKALIKGASEALGIPLSLVDAQENERGICVSCNRPIDENEYGTEAPEGGYVCQSCLSDDECEPIAVVIYSDEPESPVTIGNYHDGTDGDFKAVYHRTDAWRGYYGVEPSDKWAQLHSDCALAWSDDEKNLADFDKILRELLDKLDIRWARVMTRSSNVFSQGYDFFVEKKHLKKAEKIAERFRKMCRDPQEFMLTAITGKGKREAKSTDYILAAYAAALLGGKKPEEA